MSVGPILAPSGTRNCNPDVKTASPTEFELRNPAKMSNFILGELVSGGQVSFMVENLPKDGTGCPGRWMFNEMMKHFGSNVTGVQGFWVSPNSDNLKEVNRLTAAGRSLEEAAKDTWTGKRAADWGYLQVHVVAANGTAGSYTKVDVLFER
jgi:hypothetical protein